MMTDSWIFSCCPKVAKVLIRRVIHYVYFLVMVHRANDWNLENPDWTGRLRLVQKGNRCIVKLEDKITGALFAQAPIDEYPGAAVEPVSDSSRYFVLRIQDDNGNMLIN